jgi:hypothetical protein
LVAAAAAAAGLQMMRDADATEKRKKMLPWFCEEEYTKKNVGAVSSRSRMVRGGHGGLYWRRTVAHCSFDPAPFV